MMSVQSERAVRHHATVQQTCNRPLLQSNLTDPHELTTATPGPGVQAAGEAAFVLVAGGLGERLGYSGIKLALPSDTARGACFLQVERLFLLSNTCCWCPVMSSSKVSAEVSSG
jgi:UDP-N-acetylglucosamine pyrophosphorylase